MALEQGVLEFPTDPTVRILFFHPYHHLGYILRFLLFLSSMSHCSAPWGAIRHSAHPATGNGFLWYTRKHKGTDSHCWECPCCRGASSRKPGSVESDEYSIQCYYIYSFCWGQDGNWPIWTNLASNLCLEIIGLEWFFKTLWPVPPFSFYIAQPNRKKNKFWSSLYIQCWDLSAKVLVINVWFSKFSCMMMMYHIQVLLQCCIHFIYNILCCFKFPNCISDAFEA